MSDTYKICAMCILSLSLILIIKGINEKMSLLLKLCITAVMFSMCISLIFPIVTYVNDLFNKSQVSKYASILIKTLGISLLSHICSSICKDAGEGSVAYFAELAGRIEILVMALPLIDEILEIAYGFLEFV